MVGRGTKWRRKIAENFNWLNRVMNITDDGRATGYSEREREFAFGKNNNYDFTMLTRVLYP